MIAILDYDMANLRSVQKAIEAAGGHARIIRTADEVSHADKVVLPGVGAFKDAVRLLRERHIDVALREHVGAGKPMMGICLGMQILFDTGYEDGTHAGLGLLSGDCVRFDVDTRLRLKVPHMGWNTAEQRTTSPLFAGIPDLSHFYFVHSYYVRPTDPSVIAATTDYGGPFVSSVVKDNLMAAQFHPEKSQDVGLKMWGNFVKL